MADITLHGNGIPCPSCELRREARDPWDSSPVPCNDCNGTGRKGTDFQAYLDAVAWAKEHYWPAKEAAWAAQNEATA